MMKQSICALVLGSGHDFPNNIYEEPKRTRWEVNNRNKVFIKTKVPVCVWYTARQAKCHTSDLSRGPSIRGDVLILQIFIPLCQLWELERNPVDLKERLTNHQTQRPCWLKGHFTLNRHGCCHHAHERYTDSSLKWNLTVAVMLRCCTATGINSRQKNQAEITALYSSTMSRRPAPCR